MQVDTEIWGEPENAYTGFNQRGGTSNINDPDFTDFPPISLCTYTDVSSYKQLLYQWINGGKLSLDNEIDKSICYVGMFNRDLPQLNIVGLYNNTKNTLDDPLYKTDNTQIQSFIFTGITNYNEFADHLDWGSSQLFTDTFTFRDYRLRRYKDGILGTAPNVSPQYNANCNSFLNIFQNFGIKSFILEINVKYKTGTDTYGVTTGIYTLKEYAEQTTAWKSEHPIVSAYCRPFWRSNKNGTYSYVKPSGYFCELMPVFTLPYISNANDITDNVSYHINVCRTTATRTGYFPIYGAISQELTNSAAAQAVQEQGRAALLVGANRGTLNNITSGGYKNYWLELDGTDDNIEYIRRGAAAYGMFFCDNIGTLANSGQDMTRWLENDMMLGTIDENGLTNGDYTRGVMNATGRQFDWQTINDSDYDPSRPPPDVDPTIYSDTTDFNILGGVASFNKMYAIDNSNLLMLAQALSTAINTRLSDLPPLDYSLETFLTSNPLDVIVSLRKYPVSTLTTGTPEPIKFGGYENANVQGIPFIKSYDKITFTFSNSARNNLYTHFGDFRDYEPFTHAELIVPFCGTVAINPADFLGHDINVHMIIDYITGACTAYIAADGLVITSISGTVGVDIPLSGIQQATLESQRVNAVMNRKSADINANNAVVGGLVSSVGFAGSLMGENVAGSIGAGAGLLQSINRFQQADLAYQKADYELKHMQIPFKQVTAGSPVASTVIENKCRLIIYRPVLDEKYNAAAYAETVGFACLMNGTINTLNLSGLTVANINTDGLQLTDTEKQMIQKAFASGVII